jgi:hypothetical protein
MKAGMRSIKDKDALKALEEDIRTLEEILSPKSA